MIPSKREMLRRQRQKRRRIFFTFLALFILIVLVLISILIARLVGGSDAEASTSLATDSSQSDASSASGSAGQQEMGNTSSPNNSASLENNSSGTSVDNSANHASNVVVPDGYEMRACTPDDLHRGSLVLVNKTHEYPFPEVDERVPMFNLTDGSYVLTDAGVEMDPMAAPAVDAMLKDFSAATGMLDVGMMNGYRSPETAQELFNASVEESGLEHAEMYIMRPGFSEHHTGLATDLFILLEEGGMGFDFTAEPYSWIGENCANYGIVLRYPPDKVDITEIGHEEWHFRYVGLPHAAAMTQLGYCLEEYIAYLTQFPVDGTHFEVTAAGQSYEIYYVPASSAKTESGYQIPVPMNRTYEISGNNFDGFIVTILPE